MGNKKVVGCFFGGGAFIALHAGYHSGPMKDIKFDEVLGVSAGSLWSCIYAFMGIDKGLEVLGTIKQTSDIFVSKDVLAQSGDLLFRAYDGFMMGYSPLQALIKKYIVGRPSIPVTVSRVNLDTGYHQHITALPDGTFQTDNNDLPVKTLEDFQDAVLCSCLTYPIVDAFIDRNGDGWIDGGFREAGPVKAALLDGATELHVCLTGPFSENPNLPRGGDPITGITKAMLIMANQNMVNDVDEVLERTDINSYFYTANPMGTSTNFNPLDIQANIKIGQAVQPIRGSDLKIID